MKTIHTITKLAFAAAAFTTAGTAHACSSGFLADLACQAGIIDQNTAQTLDRLNAQTGQPVDNAIYQGMDALVPGAGTVARGYAGMQNRGSPFPAPQTPVYAPAPTYAPQKGYNPGYNPGYAAPAMTLQCNTPMGNVVIGVPMQAGSPCWVASPMGPVSGIAGF